MWGLFAGIVIGALQFLAVYKLGGMIFGGKGILKAVGGALFLVKMALLVFILYLISTVPPLYTYNLLWTAGGMLIGLILGWLYMYKIYKRRRRT
jgi:hypothetical protein